MINPFAALINSFGSIGQFLKSNGGDQPTWVDILNVSSTTQGITVEAARSAPASADTQNVYSCTYTPSAANQSGAALGGSASITPMATLVSRVGNYMISSVRFRMTSNGTGAYGFTLTLPESGASFTGNSVAGCAVGDPTATQNNFARVRADTARNLLIVEGFAATAMTAVDFYGTVMFTA